MTFRPAGSLEDAIEDLKGRGVEFPAGTSEHGWGHVATFRAPDGNDLQPYEPPEG